ncbi:efflux RND transporter periplasmic adaptor subunit [Pseudodonghicola flavimaris]|uniref:Efflux RND transporter periplasmic adaptor subunit n=1 Tax=Pseudodonghicola flavimaris TaxID=3050036 RepID=A0ABT7F7B5_9RHOB|nr:efflux RND transporter periplasmic adaptor subunit [Pseudodonghicola flavimaris]MDK3020516.1 efflux RND transporter periplasmic adaptor subunit [Pseudodonghicola flavimaris]
MRPIPFLTALLVTATLFLLVFKRDALLAFARDTAPTASEATAETAPTEAAPQAVAAGEEERKAMRVVVLRSVARTIDSAVVLRGETRAARQVEVQAEITGAVFSEPRRKGTFVAAGDVLCKLDPGTRQATLAQARAALAEARAYVPEAQARQEEAHAVLDEAQINYTAAEKLSQGGFTAQTTLLARAAAVRSAEAAIASAEAGVEAAQAGIEAAQSAVAAAEREITQLTITAPFAGLLESDAAELGSLMQPGSPCAQVIQLDPIKVVGYVPETEVARVTLSAPAQAVLATGEEIRGAVSFLSRSADQTTRTFEVEITVPNPDLSIRDGQTASIAIAAEGATAHKLPQSALTLNNEGRLGVRVVEPDNLVGFRPVEVLRDEADGVWVGGLGERADVIVVGQDFVTAGVAVIPSYREVSQ